MSISDNDINSQPADDGLPPVVAGAVDDTDGDEAEDDKDGDEAEDSDPEGPES